MLWVNVARTHSTTVCVCVRACRVAALYTVDRLKSEVITSAITHYQHIAVLQARHHIIKRILNRQKVKHPDRHKVGCLFPVAVHGFWGGRRYVGPPVPVHGVLEEWGCAAATSIPCSCLWLVGGEGGGVCQAN